MELPILKTISISNFIFHAIISVISWLIVEWTRKRTENITLRSGRYLPLQTVFLKFEIIFEPVILVHITGKLIMLNPIYYSAVAIVLLIIFFPWVRSYLSGRIILFRSFIKYGEKIIFKKRHGRVIKRNRLGLIIIADYDRIYVNYTKLLKTGFTLPEKDNNAKFSFIEINAKNVENFNELKSTIYDIMITMPYTDHSFVPEILPDESQEKITAKILLHENSDINAVVKLIQKQDIKISILKSKN